MTLKVYSLKITIKVWRVKYRSDAIKLPGTKMEQSVAKVSAKVADAVEMTQQAKHLFEHFEQTLKEAGLALEELYIALGEKQE